MQRIQAVLFEPVGCLAEFPCTEFNEIATSVFGLAPSDARAGSEAYWQLLGLMQESRRGLTSDETARVEALELQAVEGAEVYEDVAPALSALRAMGIDLLVASSLSAVAVNRFLDKFSLRQFFSAVWTRDSAGGVRVAPLAKAIQGARFEPQHFITLADTLDGLEIAKEVGTNSMLMIDDPDEARRLAMHNPAGGIVSLHELPDAIRLVAENSEIMPQR